MLSHFLLACWVLSVCFYGDCCYAECHLFSLSPSDFRPAHFLLSCWVLGFCFYGKYCYAEWHFTVTLNLVMLCVTCFCCAEYCKVNCDMFTCYAVFHIAECFIFLLLCWLLLCHNIYSLLPSVLMLSHCLLSCWVLGFCFYDDCCYAKCHIFSSFAECFKAITFYNAKIWDTRYIFLLCWV